MNFTVEAGGTTLDVEIENLNSLRNSIESMKFNEIVEKSTEAALKFEFGPIRNFRHQPQMRDARES